MKFPFFLALALSVFFEDTVPYKPDAEFAIRLDMKFKVRPQSSSTTVNVSETMAEYKKRTSNDQLPFLTLFVTINEVKLGETRMRILRDGRIMMNNKKIELGKEFKLEVGFTDDAKDRVSGYEHIIYFVTSDKKDVNRIVISIDPNGDYFVNGQKRGRL
ncbi:MAG: hypothetical protein KF725_06090 [Cyclobacteriaceae bacterium]|nr:hypothetical protein [Cyclobacteriaceae bacterium]UYN85176.1 MAG: hypothetical protein KIT51_09720 [Cyclobacteriaceae bacterium]